LIRFHRTHPNAVATIAIVQVEDAARYGTVDVDSNDRVNGFVEKTGANASGMINGGVYVFNQTVWESFPEGPASLERDVFPVLLSRGVYASKQHGMFIDIGIPSDYARAQELLRFV
jgi:NDP-sugar pyrophosphorylase family protein